MHLGTENRDLNRLVTDKYIRLTNRAMVLYSPVITPRLLFITEFIGNELVGNPIVVTADKGLFLGKTGLKINYSAQRFSENEAWIPPHSLLFEKGVAEQAIDCFEWEGNKVFLKTGGDIPFDIFAATFYLLSRYEEYLPHKKDLYGRYAFENSLAFREGFLSLPLVNIWLHHFRNWLSKRFPGFHFRLPAFSFIPTYDIDEAWSFKYKTPGRSLAAMMKNVLRGEWHTIRERKKVRNGKLADPFDSYEWMDDLHEQFALKPYYFFLVAGKTSKYDRNIPPREGVLRALIWQHADKYEIGVHPSWQSGDKPSLIRSEKNTVEDASGKEVISSRQHFIRFNLPETFRHLIDAGIKKDFSMGYGSINGFRASVASPFFWYDLEKDEQTGLLLYPFCFMEANAFFEQKLSPTQALEEMLAYYRRVKAVNGTFISIWHNTFLGTSARFAGWREVYKEFIGLTVSV